MKADLHGISESFRYTGARWCRTLKTMISTLNCAQKINSINCDLGWGEIFALHLEE